MKTCIYSVKAPNANKNRTVLGKKFKESRKDFDKKARQAERQYNAKQRDKITSLKTNDPKTFWDEINKLGPTTTKQEIDCVNLENGSVSYNPDDILKKWKEDFSGLFNDTESNQVSDEFLESTRKLIQEWEEQMDSLKPETNNIQNEQTRNESELILNSDITLKEVTDALKDAKTNKATGIENIPNEVLKCEKLHKLLLKLFQLCFDRNILPTKWDYSIIHPILKKGKDYRVPLNHRSISLMSTVAKLFNSILSKRITEYLDSNELLCEEQNGFRKLRSCIDHIYTLYSILRRRKDEKLSTFLCFIDFAKAFDSVNHELLFAKILSIGITGKIYKVIKTMYKNLHSCVKVENMATDWFAVERGVRQGDNLAPVLFAIFINDLALDINDLNLGIQMCDNSKLSVLMYADDIIILSETENDMQNMLDTLHSWSEKWQLKMNIDKTKIMHCRKASMKPTDKTFNIGHQTIDLCKSYRYLGFEICETVEFTKGVKLLHEAGGRALGAMISKHFSIKGLSFPVYEKLYYNTVVPVADYASEIWGFKKYDFADKLQSRAARTFLGVGKRAPIPYLTGETCWMEVQLRHHLNMIRLWARIINMSSNRLPKIAYLSEKEKNRRNSWALEIKTILGKCDLLNHYNMSSLLGMSNKNFLGLVKHRLTTIAAENWKAECAGMPKLRTYVKIKSDYCQEPTLLKTLSTKKRAVLSKLRSGTFPIEIEKGRYRQLPVERRICKLCTKQAIEDEIHFVIKCPAYDQERQTMFNIANQKLTIDLQELSDEEQFKTLLTSPESICAVANYLTVSLDVRSAKY